MAALSPDSHFLGSARGENLRSLVRGCNMHPNSESAFSFNLHSDSLAGGK